MKLKTLKKAPFELAQILAMNSNIVRLLYDDQSSALADPKDFSLSVEDLINKN